MSQKPRLLVVDDESGHRMMVKAVMQDQGFEVLEAGNGLQCLDMLEQQDIDVVLLDIKMPGMDGMQVLDRIHRLHSGVQVVMLTAFGSVGSAVDAMKQGAFDYLTKPADIDELKSVIQMALDYSRLLRDNTRPGKGFKGVQEKTPIIGQSPAMHRVMDLVHQVGPSEANVLIMGESGTGKELVARALHQAGPRREGPLVSINCAALPPELLESELFGYRKGAFTGAAKDKPGKFQLAENGTLFLDEIGEFPLQLQAKLLRALQEKVVQPLGGTQEIPVDVRFVAATNKDLLHEVRQGNFRQDLYYRLNVVELTVPPLRERMEDLPFLVNHFVEILGEKNRKQVRGINNNFLQALKRYHWPGNVRELENVMERAIILCRSDVLDAGDLPESIAAGDGDGNAAHENTWEEGLGNAEKETLEKALKANNGHRESTARTLGMSRRTLQYKLKKHGLTRKV
ncbi:sigma-54 dependent transcriptional regulator [Desulfonatronospira sp.]|uniref:sigma-54-dependent transcriptional regulator n=1 Tax=Desulfonatronospira sp. TaxID=1962951 RepID=UPI0025C2317E|nr:sigma-54 dependent transcriptional regulator [Desulfonatronospira sp.]